MAGSSNKTAIGSEFESFVSKSKSYIDSRNREELGSLRDEIDDLGRRLNEALERSREGEDVNFMAAVKLMASIIRKFNDSVTLMENLKSEKPLLQEFDTKQMLDVLLPNIRCLVEYENWRKKPRP